MSRLTATFAIGLRGLATLLLSRRARRALCGLIILRRVYEYVLLMATVEGMQPVRRPHYQGYVDALNVLAAKATLIAKTL
jgi:hypothetical protein